jgi:hypothetical protein
MHSVQKLKEEGWGAKRSNAESGRARAWVVRRPESQARAGGSPGRCRKAGPGGRPWRWKPWRGKPEILKC